MSLWQVSLEARGTKHRLEKAGIRIKVNQENIFISIDHLCNLPALTYGLNSININNTSIRELDSIHGIIRQVCCLRNGTVLDTWNINEVKSCINNFTLSLFNPICSDVSSTRSLCVFVLCQYITSGSIIPGCVVDRIINLISKPKSTRDRNDSDVFVDSPHNLLLNEFYLMRFSFK